MSAKRTSTVVDRAIAEFGSRSEFRLCLSAVMDEEITRQMVHGWIERGIFPRRAIPYVAEITSVTIEEMLRAKPRERDAGNIVGRAIRLLGERGTTGTLAAELTKLAGGKKKITRQMVNGWLGRGQFPTDVVPYVHMLTRIPVRDLIDGNRRLASLRRKSRETEDPGT